MSRKRWLLGAAVAGAALIIGVAAWSLRDEYAYARIATGYAAQQTCSCVHVSGRSLDNCLGDIPEEARANIDIRQSGASVRASVLLGAVSAQAEYRQDYGCRLLD